MAISVADPAPHSRLTARVAARALLSLTTALMATFVWLQFGPSQLGGRASYVITDGISMLPNFRANGLVIAQAGHDYQVGQVVAYHNRQLGAVVMHRIVARQGDRYVFKGDNNDFRDSYHPTESELVGKEWVYLPGFGRYLLMLREPQVFAAVVALIALVSFGNAPPKRRRRHGRVR